MSLENGGQLSTAAGAVQRGAIPPQGFLRGSCGDRAEEPEPQPPSPAPVSLRRSVIGKDDSASKRGEGMPDGGRRRNPHSAAWKSDRSQSWTFAEFCYRSSVVCSIASAMFSARGARALFWSGAERWDSSGRFR